MRIKRMTASFGVLNGQTLELTEGLNIIYAPNESGKSTWCAFIRAMFYGVDSSERQRAGALPDKTKHLPWSGAPMEGTMDIEFSGGEVTLSRWTKSPSAPLREFSAAYTGTADTAYGLNGANVGEAVLGVPRSVFERSAFIRQSGLPVEGSPELERRIAAIVSTGEEGASYSEADERLRSMLRRRRHNKYGRLPELEAERESLDRRISVLKNAADEHAGLSEEQSRAKAALKERNLALDGAVKASRESAMARIADYRSETERRERELAEATAARDGCREKLARSLFGDSDPDEIRESVLQNAEELDLAGKSADRPPSPFYWIIPLFLFAAFFIMGFLVALPLLIVSALMLIIAVVMIIRYLNAEKKTREAVLSCEEILGKYGAISRQEILDAFAGHERMHGELKEAEARVAAAQALLAKARDAGLALESEILGGLEQGSPEIAAARRAVSEAESELESVSRERAMFEGRCKALGDPLVLETERIRLESEHERVSFQYDALTLAIETMREASEEIQKRFSPRLGQLATEYMSFLTGGRYDELLLDRNFAARARRSGDTVARESAFLSEGAVGQLYLALRLAICALALPENDMCPIILDDALVDFDEERTKKALELLSGISKKRQVILFTCHKYQGR